MGDDMNRKLAQVFHLLAGVITVATIIYLSPVVGTLMFIVFIIYELNEDWHISDSAFIDILFYAIGLYVAALMLEVIGWILVYLRG